MIDRGRAGSRTAAGLEVRSASEDTTAVRRAGPLQVMAAAPAAAAAAVGWCRAHGRGRRRSCCSSASAPACHTGERRPFALPLCGVSLSQLRSSARLGWLTNLCLPGEDRRGSASRRRQLSASAALPHFAVHPLRSLWPGWRLSCCSRAGAALALIHRRRVPSHLTALPRIRPLISLPSSLCGPSASGQR